ncbi:DUF2635 domain-containing protein [Vibrio cholerae]
MLIIVKPAKKNVKVRKENGAHLSVDGEQVESSSFWKRQAKAGDVVILNDDEAKAWRDAIEADKTKRREEAAKVKADLKKEADAKAKAEKAAAKKTETQGE